MKHEIRVIMLVFLLVVLASCGGGVSPTRTGPIAPDPNNEQESTPPGQPEEPQEPQPTEPTLDSIGFRWEALEGDQVLHLQGVYPMEMPNEEWVAANPLPVSFERLDDGSDDVLMHLPTGSRWGIGSMRDVILRLRHVSADHVMWGCEELSFEYVLYWWADRSPQEVIYLQYWDYVVYVLGGVPVRARGHELYSWEGGKK